MKIITLPDPRLRKKSRSLTIAEINSDKMRRFIVQLAESMTKGNGIGIAAPQVGENIRVIIIDTDKGQVCFINPKILWKSFRQEVAEEGCLSVPEVYGQVKRAKSVLLIYRDQEGKRKKLKAKGLFARVLQHEIDHLDGVLFIDRMIKKGNKKII